MHNYIYIYIYITLYIHFIELGWLHIRSEKTVNKMNGELRDVLEISTQHTGPSHMWTAETLNFYLQFLTKELRSKRKKHNLPFSARGMILMDKAPQHSSSTFRQLRERFERDANCILIHGESHDRVAIPPGLDCQNTHV